MIIKSRQKQADPYSGSYSSRILRLVQERGASKTACPSEILPAHLKKSPATMARVRKAAEKLAEENKIEILRGGKTVLVGSKGPVRLRLKKTRTASSKK